MPYDRALLKKSFQILHAREPHIPKHFYSVFFKLHPEMEAMFHSRNVQELMFARTLVSIIDKVDDAPWLDEQLDALGKRHAKMNIKPEMWQWFQHALMTTFEEIAGDDWTPEIEATWTAALTDITSRVRKAAEVK